MEEISLNLENQAKKQGFKYILGVDEVGRGCEHPSAEVLTNNGWKHYYNILPTDKILSYTSKNNIEWQPVDNIIEKNFDGELIELKNSSIHILVTPDHCFDVLRRVFKRNKQTNNKLKMIGTTFRGRKKVTELKTNDFIPRGGKWSGDNTQYFVLPAVERLKYDSSKNNYDEKYILMKDWAAFIGIYLAEGCCVTRGKWNNGYTVVISQSKEKHHKEYKNIETLLNKLPFTFHKNKNGFIMYNKQLYTYLKQFNNVYGKFIPNYIKKLNIKLLNILLDWLIMGDGACYQRKNGKKVCTYYTVSPKLKDDVEEVLLKAGWTYNTYTRKPRDNYIRGRLLKKENQKTCFEIRIRRNIRAHVKSLHKNLIPYKGKVFCLSLSRHHNFYVRRSGTGYFTGNSLAGPVVAAATHISEKFDVSGIKDSKKLSRKTREKLFERITKGCLYSIGLVSERTIDKINIKEATKLAMKKAILVFNSADFVLVDGNFIPSGLNICAKPIIKGDSLSVSIAAASIVAKVFRDGLMNILHSDFPIYNWKKNKGYGTKEHRDAIKKYGPCKYHRKTFGRVKEYL